MKSEKIESILGFLAGDNDMTTMEFLQTSRVLDDRSVRLLELITLSRIANSLRNIESSLADINDRSSMEFSTKLYGGDSR